MTSVKICGIKDPETLRIAASAGARFAGFVFYPPSPRFVTLDIAYTLAHAVPTGMRSVGLFVEPTDQELLRVISSVPLDMIQLHGDETPERVGEIAALCNMPVIKALRLSGPEDLENVADYEDVADWLLFDSKIDHPLPGGTGQRFDWQILSGRSFKKPWMLSGGLTPENVREAIELLHPSGVDVSSGVESTRGIKDPEKIQTFLKTVQSTHSTAIY
jgi:phosphoribosylanthranilate isomerase